MFSSYEPSINQALCWIIAGHNDKPNIVRYHSTARNVLTSAAYDMTVKLWDLNKETDASTLNGHSEPVEQILKTITSIRDFIILFKTCTIFFFH